MKQQERSENRQSPLSNQREPLKEKLLRPTDLVLGRFYGLRADPPAGASPRLSLLDPKIVEFCPSAEALKPLIL
jgi:hypothetical protein